MLQWVTGIICAVGTGLIVWMSGLKQLEKVNTASLYYVGGNAIGIVLVLIAAIIDYSTQVFDGWLVQILFFIISTWATMWIFRRKR